jgi:hypothetical protein
MLPAFSIPTRRLLQKNKTPILAQQPYSPDLSSIVPYSHVRYYERPSVRTGRGTAREKHYSSYLKISSKLYLES